MARRKDSQIVIEQKRRLIGEAIKGRTIASSTRLSASFGLPIEDVQRILRNARVEDHG